MKNRKPYKFNFVKDAVVCKTENGKPILYKVLEDMKTNDQRTNLRVVILEENTKKNGKVTYKEGSEQLLSIKEKITTIEEVKRAKLPKQQTLFTFDQEVLQGIAQDIKKPVKKQALPESESEKESDESEKVKPKYAIKKGTKGVQPKQAEQPVKVERTTRSGRVSRAHYEESPESAESEQERSYSQSQSQSQQQEGGTGTQNAKTKKPKKTKTPTKFVKGKYNPQYRTLIDTCDQLEGNAPKFQDQASIQLNNKEIIRAAKIGNLKLLEDILSQNAKISNLFERWGPENDFNGVELMFKRQDKAMILAFVKAIANQKLKLTTTPRCSLKEVNTGYNDKYAYGTRTRKVALGRGNREGNNAFVYDLSSEGTWSQFLIKRLLQLDTDPALFGVLTASGAITSPQLQQQIYELVPYAVRSGNYKVAAYQIALAFKKGAYYGYNQVHVDVLNLTNAAGFGPIKKPSATKKTVGQYLITPIHCAAINPNAGFLEHLLEVSQDYNIQDELMRKPIHYAAVSQTSDCLELLLRLRVDPREGDRLKTTPLMLASQWGRSHNVELLAGDNVNGKNKEGNAAIHFASMGGHLETVKVLLKHGAQINQPGQGRMTPLIMASAYGHFELVKYLHEQGAKVLMKDKFGRSSLLMAARNGNIKILSYLLMNGADFNQADSSKNSPIHYAAAYGFANCIDELIKAGADQNLANSWKLTPLSVALQKNHFGVVKALLNYPTTDVNCKDDDGRTLVSSSLSKFTADSFEYIKFLIEDKSADVTISDLQGKTPLHYAVALNRKNVKQYYAKWHEMNKAERREIKDSYANLIRQVLDLLLKHGGDVNVQDLQGYTPFIEALKSQNYENVMQLMGHNPQLDLVDKNDGNVLNQMIDSGLFLKIKGLMMFQQILKQVNFRLLNTVNAVGFTPLLDLVNQYCTKAQSNYGIVFQKKVSRIQQDKYEVQLVVVKAELAKQLEEQPQKFEQIDQENEEDVEDKLDEEEDEEDEDEDEDRPYRRKQKMPKKRYARMARTFQTARRSHGAFPAQMSQPFGFNQQGFNNGFGTNNNTLTQYHQKSFYYENRSILVGLTMDENNQITNEATQDCIQIEDGVLKVIQLMVELGADPHATVGKLKKLVEDPEFKGDPYSEHGLKNIAHFIFEKYHSLRFIKGILQVAPISLVEPMNKGKHPIHLFAGQVSNTESRPFPKSEETSYQFIESLIPTLDVRVRDDNKDTPTSILACRYSPQVKFILELFIKQHGQLNNLNKNNQVPLHHWVKSNNLAYVEQLLTLDADPNFKDRHGRTALHHAINKSNSQADASFEMEELLLKYGAKSGIRDNYQRTPLFYAFTKIGQLNQKSEIDPFETVSSLMADKDCDVNVVDVYKRSPLHYASMRGSVISGRYMIKKGNPVDQPDQDGNTPIALAFISGHSNFCTMLVDNKADVSRIATIVDYEKLKREAKEARELRRKQGEEIESEAEDNDVSQPQNDEYEQQQQSQSMFGLFGGFNNGFQPNNAYLGGKAPRRGGLFNQQNNNPPQPTTFAPGKYSYFKLAIKHGWQGVAYLLISDQFDLQRAIEDAMMENQFKLVRTLLRKVKEDSEVRKCNEDGQNLFHIFAQKGREAPDGVDMQIISELINRGVDKKLIDKSGRTPLHYSAINNFVVLSKTLLMECDPNIVDQEHNTAFTWWIQLHYEPQHQLYQWMQAKSDMNTKFKPKGKDYIVTPFLFFIQDLHIENEIELKRLIDYGAEINCQNQAGETPLIMAIHNNSMKLVNFLLSQPQFDKRANEVDRKGKTPIHHVVQPLEFGSYENVQILEVLIKLFDYNAKDSTGRTPMDYANEQDSGVMKKFLKKYNAVETKRQVRMPTSIISQAEWVDEEIDVESDAQKYLDQCGEVVDTTKKDPRLVVDQQAFQNGGKLEVHVDPEIGPYTLLMTKVDIGNGLYSENVFYKMQVLHELNRNVYILYTRWGRTGTPGQFQMTPFDSAETATKEFCKIFSSKSGSNDFKKICRGEEHFEKKFGKYQLMTVTNCKSYKSRLEPFDYSKHSKYPPSSLEHNIRRVMLQFSQVKLYQKDMEQFQVDLDFMPLEKLDKKQLEKAKMYLAELQELAEELVEQRKKADLDVEEISRIQGEVNEKSSRFYELIPQREMHQEPLPPLDTQQAILQRSLLIETLLLFELTSKILLGAHLNKMIVNPLNYCFNALNVRMMTLPQEHPEYKLVSTYINKSDSSVKVSNIFCIERRGEAERFESNKSYGNRVLLWHGSKISNFMAILAQGLKVAPPWAITTGAMFGKGIYFADMFQKSYAYTQDWSFQYSRYNGQFQTQHHSQSIHQDEQDEIQRYRYMLLCEVALGTSKEMMMPMDVHQLENKYQSVKGVGVRGPDYKQSITLSNGCQVPVGHIVDYEYQKADAANNRPSLQHNEYIVYDETKVKIRYMIQLDTKHNKDLY